MEIKWNDTKTSLPRECAPVLAKVFTDGLLTMVILTHSEGAWVTDTSVSEVYGVQGLSQIHPDYTPIEWAYLEDEWMGEDQITRVEE